MAKIIARNALQWIEQEGHYSEIYLYLLEVFRKTHPDFDKNLIEGNCLAVGEGGSGGVRNASLYS